MARADSCIIPRQAVRCLVLVLLPTLLGCGPSRLTVRASRDLGCPAASVSIDDLGDGRLRADGCGRSVGYSCAPDTTGREACAVVRPSAGEAVQRQVERDTGCPAHAVEVERTEGAYAVHACGRALTYRCEPRNADFVCERDAGPGIVDDDSGG